MITFKKIDKHHYTDWKPALLSLYIQTFTKGLSAQHIYRKEAENYLDAIFDLGFGMFGFSDSALVAVLLCTPLSFDKACPAEVRRRCSESNTLYIAEVLVAENLRGKGLGKLLLNAFEESVSQEIRYCVLRVWTENVPAIKLYKKFGFQACGIIHQQKLNPHSKEPFRMTKQYMIKSY